MKAMILAAGQGKRLRPLTNTIPKPLIPINGIPLIVHHIYNLRDAGIKNIIINLAYLGDKIESYLGNGSQLGVNISYSHESGIGLETGGGIYNALPLLGQEPFIVINADVFCAYPFEHLNIKEECLAHIVLVNNPPHNLEGDFSISDGLLIDKKEKTYTFSGIAIYKPQFFYGYNSGRYSVTPLINKAINANKVSANIYQGTWFDIGTKERLEQAQQFFSKYVLNQS